jgi:hypothetical protein
VGWLYAVVRGGRPAVESVQVPMDVVVNFSDGSGTLTATKMNNGTHGANWGPWQEWHDGVFGDPNQYSSIENHDAQLPFQILCDGQLYDGSEGQGMTFDFSGAPVVEDVWHWNITASLTSVVALLLIRYDSVLGPGTYYNDTFMIAGANYTIPQMQHSETFWHIKAHSEGSLGGGIPYESGWVIVGVRHDVTNDIGECFVQDLATGEVLGGSRSVHGYSASTLSYIRLNSYLRDANSGTGSHKVKLMAFKSGAAPFPPYTLTVPTPASVSASQTGAGEVTVTWASACNAFLVERNVDAAGWTTLDNDFITVDWEYVDATVAAGQSVVYRVTAQIGSQASAAATTAPVVVT